MAIEKHKMYLAKAKCKNCGKEFEGHAGDVSEEIWHHEEDDGHDVRYVDEWEEVIVFDDENESSVEIDDETWEYNCSDCNISWNMENYSSEEQLANDVARHMADKGHSVTAER